MKLVLYGNPATKKNSMQIFKNSRTGQRYLSQSKRYKDYARDCGRQITGKYRLNVDYPINLKCVYYRKTKHRVDLTNLLAATRVLFDKDRPRVEIEIEKVE